jgi:hypothetical protein
MYNICLKHRRWTTSPGGTLYQAQVSQDAVLAERRFRRLLRERMKSSLLEFRIARDLGAEIGRLLLDQHRYHLAAANLHATEPDLAIRPNKRVVEGLIGVYPRTVSILRHISTRPVAKIASETTGQPRTRRLTIHLHRLSILGDVLDRPWIVFNHLPTDISSIADQVAYDQRFDDYSSGTSAPPTAPPG